MTSQNLVKSLYTFIYIFLLSLLNFNYTERNLVLFQLYYWQEAVTWTCVNTIIHSAGQLTQHGFTGVCFLCHSIHTVCGLTEKKTTRMRSRLSEQGTCLKTAIQILCF